MTKIRTSTIDDQLESSYIDLLFQSTHAFAEDRSNPVLSVLGGEESISEEEKIPKDYLKFSGDLWRAYYHCHSSPLRREEEHGHFHIFYKPSANTKQHYAHLAYLSMDSLGQPLQLGLVNRWVTDGPWMELSDVHSCFMVLGRNISTQFKSLSLVEKWLLSFIGIYKDETIELYRQRDALIEKHLSCPAELKKLQNNREIYGFTKIEIDLASKLSFFFEV